MNLAKARFFLCSQVSVEQMTEGHRSERVVGERKRACANLTARGGPACGSTQSIVGAKTNLAKARFFLCLLLLNNRNV